ncbi:MAG: hypothetical protein M3437_02175 [Chloroflexota bacterium]|nr:hypothetical protein [Chloroflexota bacterium]MDQ5866070.1 hypothetical protein [Chloroflexota bacterium]
MTNPSSSQTSGGQLSYGLPAPVETRSKRVRPPGVTILAVLHFICTGLLLLSVYFLIYYPLEPDYRGGSGGVQSWIEEERTMRMFPLQLGIASTLIVGIGLWRLKSWGRDTALVLLGLVISVTMLAMASSRHLSGSAIATILLSGAAFSYLCRSKVRAAFTE